MAVDDPCIEYVVGLLKTSLRAGSAVEKSGMVEIPELSEKSSAALASATVLAEPFTGDCEEDS